jgi:hypothetical protein
MAKYNPPKNPVKTREAYPKYRKTKTGVELICPFCTPPHPLAPGKPSACGTEVQVKAVQHMITQRTAKQNGVTCLKCHKSMGGDMVACQNGFVHTFDCSPGTVVMSVQPEYSKYAEFVYKLPESFRKLIERTTGEAKEIKEIDSSGQETGNILGYFFYKNDV